MGGLIMETDRKDFLVKIYEQMFNDIDRHHKIVWLVIGVLVSAIALIALSEKGLLPIDLTVSIILLLSFWVIAHVYDSNYWYNRNLVIIANIERQFLVKEDLRNIHYYFGKHRGVNSLQTSLKIQLYFAWGLVIIVLIYHFFEKIAPGFKLGFTNVKVEWWSLLPYVVGVLGYLFIVRWIRDKRRNNYAEFLRNSPGINIDTKGIDYGDGHTIDK